MIKVLTMECAKKVNFFPPKGGISAYYSPCMIMHHECIDYSKHCVVPFGTFVQALQETILLTRNSLVFLIAFICAS